MRQHESLSNEVDSNMSLGLHTWTKGLLVTLEGLLVLLLTLGHKVETSETRFILSPLHHDPSEQTRDVFFLSDAHGRVTRIRLRLLVVNVALPCI